MNVRTLLIVADLPFSVSLVLHVHVYFKILPQSNCKEIFFKQFPFQLVKNETCHQKSNDFFHRKKGHSKKLTLLSSPEVPPKQR